MMRAHEIISESKTIFISDQNAEANARGCRVWINPSFSEMQQILQKKSLRAWASMNRVYVWDAYQCYHEAILDALILDGEIPIAQSGSFIKMVMAAREIGLGGFDDWEDFEIRDGILVASDDRNIVTIYDFPSVRRMLGLKNIA